MSLVGVYLRCIKLQTVWWGTLYEPDKSYCVIDEKVNTVQYVEPSLSKKHGAYQSMILKIGSKMVEMRKVAEDDLDKERFDHLHKQQRKLTKLKAECYKTIELPFVTIKSDNDSTDYSFCAMRKKDISILTGTKDVDRTTFKTTVQFLEDYFDLTPIERENKLNDLGI